MRRRADADVDRWHRISCPRLLMLRWAAPGFALGGLPTPIRSVLPEAATAVFQVRRGLDSDELAGRYMLLRSTLSRKVLRSRTHYRIRFWPVQFVRPFGLIGCGGSRPPASLSPEMLTAGLGGPRVASVRSRPFLRPFLPAPWAHRRTALGGRGPGPISPSPRQ